MRGPGLQGAPAVLLGKLVLMPAIAARAARHGGDPRVLAAQGFSWGGDLALSARGRGAFLAGVASFAAAQVDCTSACRRRSAAPLLASPGRRVFLVAGGVAALATGLLAAREDRALAAPVAAYGGCLVTMVASAAAVDPSRGRRRLLTGASLFLVSDALIGVRKLVLHDGAPAVEVAVAATYAAGQWCLGDALAAG